MADGREQGGVQRLVLVKKDGRWRIEKPASTDQPVEPTPPYTETDQDWLLEQAEKRLAAANEAMRSTGRFFFLLLSVGAYIGVVVWSATDEQLLRDNPLKLPIIGVEVPLTGFYVIAPLFFVGLYIHLLMHLGVASKKLQTFLDIITPFNSKLSNWLRNDVYNFLPGQWMVGHHDGWLHAFISGAVALTLLVIPSVILFVTFAWFLPYQSASVSYFHLAMIACYFFPLALYLWWFDKKVQPERLAFLYKNENDVIKEPRKKGRLPWVRYFSRLPLGLAVIAFLVPFGTFWLVLSFLIQTDQYSEQVSTRPNQIHLDLSGKFLTHNAVTPEVIEQLKSKDEGIRKKALAKILGLDLRERHLKKANFSQTVVPKADLTEAILVDSNFRDAYLQQVTFSSANLEWADFTNADLSDADLRNVKNLESAELGGDDCQDSCRVFYAAFSLIPA